MVLNTVLVSVLSLLDYAKAFDTVWRDGLYYKMINMGIDIHTIKWIKAWLTNRQNWVRYNDTAGEKRIFKQGVPQGAVLSPILFLLYQRRC